MLNIKDVEYNKIVKDILDNENFKKLASIKHHGTSRYEHLMRVSYKAYQKAKKKKYDYISTARGALLHDFYLEGNERSNFKRFTDTFTHPKKVLKTCNDNFKLSEKEKNIIISHMFPLFPSLPKYKESWLVNFTDNSIGLSEMLKWLFRIK